MPISENQKKILDDQRQENKNKAIFLTIPYVISAVIIVGALMQNRFSFANVQDLEWAPVALASIIAIVGIYVTFSKLKNNEINNNHNIVKKFNNLDILFPCRRGGIVSVMEKKTKDEEENDSISRLIKLLDKHLTDFTDKIVDSLDKRLDEAKDLLDSSLLKQIKETLVHLQVIREDIKKDLDELHEEILPILSEAKQLTKKANSLDIEGTFSNLQSAIETFKNAIKIVEDKVESLKLGRFGVPYFDTTQSGRNGHKSSNNQTEGDSNQLFGMLKKIKEEVGELKKAFEELKKSVEEIKNEQTQSTEPNNSGSSNAANPLQKEQDEKKKVIEKNRLLKSEKRMKELEKENAKLEKELSEQEKADEWKEKINGKASEFFYYLLESIKLEEKMMRKEKSVK